MSDRGAAREDRDVRPDQVRAVRLGHGANCSSVGSVVDTLFVSAAVGGAILAAICAAMRTERVRVVEGAQGEGEGGRGGGRGSGGGRGGEGGGDGDGEVRREGDES